MVRAYLDVFEVKFTQSWWEPTFRCSTVNVIKKSSDTRCSSGSIISILEGSAFIPNSNLKIRKYDFHKNDVHFLLHLIRLTHCYGLLDMILYLIFFKKPTASLSVLKPSSCQFPILIDAFLKYLLSELNKCALTMKENRARCQLPILKDSFLKYLSSELNKCALTMKENRAIYNSIDAIRYTAHSEQLMSKKPQNNPFAIPRRKALIWFRLSYPITLSQTV